MRPPLEDDNQLLSFDCGRKWGQKWAKKEGQFGAGIPGESWPPFCSISWSLCASLPPLRIGRLGLAPKQ